MVFLETRGVAAATSEEKGLAILGYLTQSGLLTMQADQQKSRSRTKRTAPISVETLEARALLSPFQYPTYPGYPTPTPTPTPAPAQGPIDSHTHHQQKSPGTTTKAAHFYQFYTGPKLAELNAVKASAALSADGSTFTFTGTNVGRINKAPAVYVWGVDRNGNLPSGPFTGRPNIRFDALVVVSLDSSLTPTARVIDIAAGKATNLPAGSATLSGKTVSVTVPASLLPSTGLSPAQYRFNYWPEDGVTPETSAVVASFLPESGDAQVGVR
jgi:hypothetical protein